MRTNTFVTGLTIVLFATISSFGQFGVGPGASLQQKEMPSIKVFSLENLAPTVAIQICGQVFEEFVQSTESPLRFAIQPNTKSLIVTGSGNQLKTVEALLVQLDSRPVPNTSEKSLRIFPMKYMDASEFRAAVQTVSPELQMHVDQRTNKLTVYGAEAEFPHLHELLEALDVPSPSLPNDVMIRFVWLVEKSLAAENSAHVPADLHDPIEALRKKIGLGELRTATQLVVQASTANSQVKASGTALIRSPVSIGFSGSIMKAGSDQFAMQIRVANKGLNEAELGELMTECAGIRIGQPVILGTTTIDSQASVFVVQVLER